MTHAVKRNRVDVDAEFLKSRAIFQNVNSRVERVIFSECVAVGVSFKSAAVHAGIVHERRNLQFYAVNRRVVKIAKLRAFDSVSRLLRLDGYKCRVMGAVIAVSPQLRELMSASFAVGVIFRRDIFSRLRRSLHACRRDDLREQK